MKNKELESVVQPVVEGLGYEFVGLRFMPQGKNSLLRIYIDQAEIGIGVDDCEKVSRQLSAVLDVEEPIQGAYTLEVSSPGLDRPLFTEAHFQRFAGAEGTIKLRTARDGRRVFTGELMGVTEEGKLAIKVDGVLVSFTLDEVDKANLVPVVKF
ncbi:MAG: ribosome maturation factor RimP [Gammaproteobacteria bacterium]|nr:ribosome maturation factor RimP [Gammaproteobacteria bacterium]